jgi:hypothetical protein
LGTGAAADNAVRMVARPVASGSPAIFIFVVTLSE